MPTTTGRAPPCHRNGQPRAVGLDLSASPHDRRPNVLHIHYILAAGSTDTVVIAASAGPTAGTNLALDTLPTSRLSSKPVSARCVVDAHLAHWLGIVAQVHKDPCESIVARRK
jgi:hypothetical protein